ncbi:steroid transmembrane transporter SLC22A24-like [Amblyomma americanum]
MSLLCPPKLAKVDLVTSECFQSGDIFGHGRFQRWLFLLTTVSMCAMHCHALVFRIISGDAGHWCKQPQGVVMIPALSWENLAIPLEADGRFSHCTVYAHSGDPNDTCILDCAKWDYYPKEDRRSVVSRWDLVCHRRPLFALAHAIHIAGSLIFISFVGLIADRVGRLSVLLSTVAALQLATLGGCFSSSYIVYVLSRFLDSGCAATVTVLSSTLLFEASTHAYRSLHLYTAMAMGMLMAEGWFAVGRLRRHHDWITMQSFILSPTVLTLYAFIVAHESPRCYIARKDLSSAEMVMLSAAKENQFPLCIMMDILETLKDETPPSIEDGRRCRQLLQAASATGRRRRFQHRPGPWLLVASGGLPSPGTASTLPGRYTTRCSSAAKETPERARTLRTPLLSTEYRAGPQPQPLFRQTTCRVQLIRVRRQR